MGGGIMVVVISGSASRCRLSVFIRHVFRLWARKEMLALVLHYSPAKLSFTGHVASSSLVVGSTHHGKLVHCAPALLLVDSP